MYESPFKIIKTYTESVAKAAAEFIDDEVFKAAFRVGVTVDKEELIRALAYDRDQYARGFADGKADVVYCCACAHRIGGLCRHPAAPEGVFLQTKDWDSCSYGIKEEEEEGDSE